MSENGQVLSLSPPGSEGVTIVLDKPRQLSLTLGTMYQAERLWERLGNLPFGSAQIFEDFVMQRLNATKLLILLTCGLQRHDPDVTLDMVGNWVRLDKVLDVFTAIGQAWQQANPEPTAAAEETSDSPPPPGGTGSTPGAAPATTLDLTTPPSGA